MKVLAELFLDDYHLDSLRDPIDDVACRDHVHVPVEMILVKLPPEFPSEKERLSME